MQAALAVDGRIERASEVDRRGSGGGGGWVGGWEEWEICICFYIYFVLELCSVGTYESVYAGRGGWEV